MAWRFLAQRVLTGEWLDWNLPLSEPQITYALSGPTAVTAKLSPEHLPLVAGGQPVLQPLATAIYAEADGIIRAGTLLMSSSWEDADWSLECAGFTTYPKGIPYTGTYSKDSVDPLDVVREIWRWVQAQPDSNLHVTVDGTTSPVRLGKNPKHTILTGEGSTGGGGSGEGEEPEPYKLAAYEAKDCGDEIDELAKQTPFDYVEDHTWADDTTVAHHVRIGYPRLGRKRDDLRFVFGENLAAMPSVETPGDDYVNEVLAIGKGEGADALQVTVAERDKRLRRVKVITNSAVGDKKRLTQLARHELAVANPGLRIAEVKVFDHPNCRLGDLSIGDDIYVQGGLPWVGSPNMWVRVTGLTIQPYATDAAMVLTVARSDGFSYGEVWQ